MKVRKSVLPSDGKETEHEKFLAYGEFDRIAFEKVTKFSRFRDISEKSKTWIGDRQTLLVYEIQDDESEDAKYRDEVFYSEGNFHVREDDKFIQSDQLFIGITILQFKNSQKKNRTQMSGFLSCCKKKIIEMVKIKKPSIHCSVLGTLGSFGLTIIWLSDQYEDILHMVTKIKNTDISNNQSNSSKSIFLSAYTIFAQNHCFGAEWERKVEAIKGEAILRLTLKRGVSEKILKSLKKWQISETEIYHSAGEHDIAIRVKSRLAFNLFSSGGDLDSRSNFSKENILQLNLQLCEDVKDGDNKSFFYYLENSDIENSILNERESVPELENIQKEYIALRELFKKYFPSTAGMVDTLDWLYSDYIAKISTASNEMWVSNFSYQFFKILECVTKFVENLNDIKINKQKVLQIINDLLSDFERQISHIAESNNLILGTPICQFRYSGQSNLTLYSYFGVIKSILTFIYENQQVSSQAEIVPLIVADVVPIIKSNLFINYNNKNDARIITINLPMMALYDPVCYYPYLLHEMFHYVVPKDRHIRNEIWGCILSIEMLNSVCKSILIQKLQLNTDMEKGQLNILFKDCILPYSYSFIINYYEKYGQFEYSNCETFEDIDKLSLTIDDYEKKIFEQWLVWIRTKEGVGLGKNLIYLFFCCLYDNKEVLKENLKAWRQRKFYEKNEIKILTNGILEFVKELDCIVDNSVSESQDDNFAKLMAYVGDEDFQSAVAVADFLREALVDIEMINVGNMELAEYLLIYTKIKKELLLNDEDFQVDTQDIIRLGIVLDFFSLKEDDDILTVIIDKVKVPFIEMYCGVYYSVHRLVTNKQFSAFIQEAEQWFDYWRTCVQLYSLRYRIYSDIFKELQKQVSPNIENNTSYSLGSIYWKKYTENLKSYGNYICNNDILSDKSSWEEKKDKIDNQIFNLNIEFIHAFQDQDDFSSLDEKRKNRIETVKRNTYQDQKYPYDNLRIYTTSPSLLPNKIVKQWHSWKYDISNVGQLGNLTAFIAQELKNDNSRLIGKNEYPIWYRGQQSVNYKLVPSIMRKYKAQKTKQTNPSDFSLVKFLRREFEEFRFMADGSQEALERVGYTEGDYIALMQHYSTASNFLDWTEDALSALYFALEGFLDKKAEKTDDAAVLYIFSPALYNRARKRMILQVEKDKRKLGIEKDIVKNLQDGIPNLAVSFNKGKYDMYLLGKEEYEDDNSEPYGSMTERDKKLPFYLPIAVYTSRLNKRIQAQNGIFLAYNIYTSPDENDEFDYISLENVQELYFKMFKDANDEDVCPFLYKIVIKKEEREKIALWVSAFGMSKEKCYPELQNVGEKIMK